MAMTDEICTIAAVFAGVGENEEPTLEKLCGAAETELRARLRRGIAPEDCRGSFICAAAMLAASHFLAARTAGVKSFTVGAVTVTSGGEGTDAADLRTQAELLMRPFCTGALGFLGGRA